MGPFKILIVEDEKTVAEAISYTVNKFFRCDSIDIAHDGLNAWKKIQETTYDLVISDWNMPRKRGDELLNDLRLYERTCRLPFLMLTARADLESVSMAVKSGVSAYLVKPFEREMLIKKIEGLLQVESANSGPEAEDSELDVLTIIDRVAKELKAGKIIFPIFPEAAFKTTEMLKNEALDIEQLVALLKFDPGISPKLIGLANSAIYQGVSAVMTTEDAVVRIGLEQTKDVVQIALNGSLYNTKNLRYKEILNSLWWHASAVASCAKQIALLLNMANPEELFTLGMLHDVGKLLLTQMLFEKYAQLDESDVLAIIDALHPLAGAALLREWGLPGDVVEAALLHHDVVVGKDFSLSLRVLAFADLFVRTLGFSLQTDDDTNFEVLAKTLKLELSTQQLKNIGDEVTQMLGQLRTTL